MECQQDKPKGATEKKSGLAFDVILNPASTVTIPIKLLSPPKAKNLTQDDIVKKLQKAKERRESREAQVLEQLAQGRARTEENIAKVQEKIESFSRQTEEKIRRSMEVSKENREQQIKVMKERLREHERRIRKNKSPLQSACVDA